MSALSSCRARRTIAARIASTSRIAVRSLAVSYSALSSASRDRWRAISSRSRSATSYSRRSSASSSGVAPARSVAATTSSNDARGASS